MNTVQLREKDSKETIMSVFIDEDGSIKGICKDGYEIIVDGEILEKVSEEEE